MTTLSRAPTCEVFDVNISKNFKPPKELYYSISLKPTSENERKEGIYEPEFGDLIALTDVRPKGIDDLNRPKWPYVLALIQGLKNEGSFKLPILSSKPIEFKKETGKSGNKLFAVYLTNLNTNMRIWKALNPDPDVTNMKIMRSVLQVDANKKKLVDGETMNGTEKEELIKHQKLKDVLGRAERVLFWSERLGFTIMAVTWVFLTDGWFFTWQSCLKYTTVVESFWMCTNLFYFLVYMGRLCFMGGKRKSILAGQIGYWFMNNVRNHPGFWLERLSLLLLAHGVQLFAVMDPKSEEIMDYCCMIIFPLLNIYFAWFGYSKEFQRDFLGEKLPDGGDNGTAKEEIQPQNMMSPPADSTAKSVALERIQLGSHLNGVDDNGKNHQSHELSLPCQEVKNKAELSLSCQEVENKAGPSSATNDLGMLETIEDRIMGGIHTKLTMAVDKNLERYSEKIQDAWQAIVERKVFEKYEEDYQKLEQQTNELAMKLCTATASFEKYDKDYQRLKEQRNDLEMKLCAATTTIEQYEDDYQSLKEQNNELALQLCAATTSSQLYRTLLHDLALKV